MNARRQNRWLAWIVLLAMVGSIVALALVMFRRENVPAGPTMHVEGGAGWPRTLIERFPNGKEGRRLVLPSPPQRIVSVTLATDEMLLDMVRTNRIIALSELAPRPGSLVTDRIGSIKHFVSADVESIIALEPDLCFLASYNRAETRSLLIDSGVPVCVFRNFQCLDDVRSNIRTVGRAVGAEGDAERLISEMDRKIDAVRQQLPPLEQWPSALVYDESGWVSGKDTVQAGVFEAAGLRNAATEAGITGYAQVSEEQVLDMNPDYLVVVARRTVGVDHHAWLVEDPALAPLRAIREKRFLAIDESLFSTVSHHIADTIVALAHQVHPIRIP
ncbi:MAG: ABC transporter substrate-binding protein [Pirellulaceae bacterium]